MQNRPATRRFGIAFIVWSVALGWPVVGCAQTSDQGESLRRIDAMVNRTSVKNVDARYGRECGLDCLYVLLKSQGVSLSLNELAAEVPIDDRGASLATLSAAARRVGYPLRAIS